MRGFNAAAKKEVSPKSENNAHPPTDPLSGVGGWVSSYFGDVKM